MNIVDSIKVEVESDLEKFNATLFRQPNSIVLAQRWYYPADSVPNNFLEPPPEGTTKVRVFFAREEDMDSYCAAYPCIRPFWTETGTLVMLDKITAYYADDYQDYKQKYWADFAPDDRQ